jgi:DNA-binding IclR family transcriptional regulator
MKESIKFDDGELLLSDSERKYRAPALEKGLDILELLARCGGAMTTSQMAVTLGRSVSELFRMVLALEYRGYIAQNNDGKDGYILTNKLFTLGIAQGSVKTLLEAALPAMKELSRYLGQSCHLVVPSGSQVAVVARFESPMDLGFSLRVGYRRNLIDTNSGALLYGFAPSDVKTEWLKQLSYGIESSRTEQFLRSTSVATEQGFIRAESDYVEGVMDYCVPIRGRHGAVAVLVVPFIAIKSQSWTSEQILSRLMDTCAQISDILVDEG